MKKYTVNEKCINCKACVRIAPNVYDIKNKKAVVYSQPKNIEDENLAEKALKVCPVGAITILTEASKKPILGSDNIKEVIKKYPILNLKLIKLSSKFRMLSNPIIWNTIAEFTTFSDAAKITGVSICEILHFINKELGLERELNNSFPNCIENIKSNAIDFGESIFWNNPTNEIELKLSNEKDFENIIDLLKNLKANSAIKFVSSEIYSPFIRLIKSYNYLYNIKEVNQKKYYISVYNNNKIDKFAKNKYEKLDVRQMKEDPFDVILKKAYETNPGDGFILIQTFVPHPLISMLTELGFDYEINTLRAFEVWVYFTKKEVDEEKDLIDNKDRPNVVIQSATPVAYPIIMRLLQSKKINKAIKIVDLKIWEETEKHLGWIVNKKADISFSALITATKLTNLDVKMPAVFVWDNFSILTRDITVTKFSDLKGKEIYLPLFEDAPPAKITKYLIENSGENIDDYIFKYGEPFGRPAKMYHDFVDGKIETLLLREPEASFAINNLNKLNIKYNEIEYGKIWNNINKGFGLFPNAGVVFKGEFVRKYPEIMEVITQELKEAINWVNTNRKAASDLAFDMMRAKSDDVELFIDRVTYKYVDGDELVSKIKEFYQILNDSNIIQVNIDDNLLDVFKI